MNIGLVASFYPVILGGAEVGLEALLDCLKSGGVKHVLFTLSKVRTGTDNDIVPIGSFGHIPKGLKLFGLPILDFMLAGHLATLIRRNCIDLLHVQDTYSLCGAVMAAEDSGIPIVLSYHNDVGIPHAHFGVPYPLNVWLDKREVGILEAASRCSLVIADSAYIAEQLARAGLRRDCVKVVYIDGAISSWAKEAVSSDHDFFRVLAVGRLQHHKGFHNLLFAAKKVLSRGTDIEIIIAGDGPYRRKLLRLAAELGLESHVTFSGYAENKTIASLYDWSDVVVVPSITPEPFGRVAVEAMSRGKVVIGSDIGGIPEIIDDGVTGFLVPPDNPADLAEKLSFLCAQPNIRKKMGRKALEMSKERFNSTKITRKVLDIYRTLRNSATS